MGQDTALLPTSCFAPEPPAMSNDCPQQGAAPWILPPTKEEALGKRSRQHW